MTTERKPPHTAQANIAIKADCQHSLSTSVTSLIKDHRLFDHNACLVVAVSGGADSVALLDLLSSLPCYSLRLVVAHLNHLLRGPESDADEEFVRKLAERYAVPCEISRVDVTELARTRRISVEEAGREARYSFFEETRNKHNAQAIAVAHHADDQAETVLIRLLRGAGTAGLSGMSPRTDRLIVRPLLGITSAELRLHLENHSVSFREDASNQDRLYLRNRIRHDLIPLLSSYNPAISERLAITARLLAEDEQLLVEITRDKWAALAVSGNRWAALPRSAISAEPLAMRLRLYRQSIINISGDLRRIEYKHCLAIDALLLNGDTGSRVSLPKGLSAVLTKDRILLARQDVLEPLPPVSCCIYRPGTYNLGNGLSLRVEPSSVPDDLHSTPKFIAYIDPESAPFPWMVNSLSTGERIQPFGMNKSRLVSDILTDYGLPRHLRCAIPLLCCPAGPLWLAGIARTSLAPVSESSTAIFKIYLEGRELLPLFP